MNAILRSLAEALRVLIPKDGGALYISILKFRTPEMGQVPLRYRLERQYKTEILH